ncbi:unnamed protein product, partial [marine sediment metagenome]
KGIDTMMPVLQYLSKASKLISTDPSYVFDIAYRIPSNITFRETRKWWREKAAWIQTAADTAEDAIIKVNDTIDDLQELENKLPAFIRDNIPQLITDKINWLDETIDDTLLPAITKIDRTFDEVNAVMEGHRQTAASLVDQLTMPGDVLLGVDKLTAAGKLGQENIIDDVASRKFNRDTEKAEEGDAVIIEEFERITKALEVPAPPPVFLSIEDMPPSKIPGIVLEEFETW